MKLFKLDLMTILTFFVIVGVIVTMSLSSVNEKSISKDQAANQLKSSIYGAYPQTKGFVNTSAKKTALQHQIPI